MNEVFKKTRELGEAIMKSEEYIAMKQMEDRAMKNVDASYTMGMFIEKRQHIEELLQQNEPDAELLRSLSDELDGLQERLQMIDEIRMLTESRNAFSVLIEQVNRVLKFIITGEMGQDEEGCGGSCDGCAGCGHGMMN